MGGVAIQIDSQNSTWQSAPDASPRQLYACLRKSLGGMALDIELQLGAGITIIFGASGAGKTTLLDCLAGLTTPDEGRVILGDRVLFDSEQRNTVPTERRRAGYLFQDLALFPHLTAEQNVQFGLAHLPKPERSARARQMLKTFRVDHVMSRKPGQLSGGERQRVALARTLVTEPEFLLLDEPLTGLDAPTKRSLIEDLRSWNARQRIPILYVTHDRPEVYALGERVIVLEQGKVVAEGTPHSVLQTPEHESVAQLAGFENVFDARVSALHPQQGTMTCQILPRLQDASTVLSDVFSAQPPAPIQLEVPLISAERGARLRVGIRAGDILIATDRPQNISARNIVPARLESLARRDAMFSVQAVLVGSESLPIRMEIHLTPGAVDSLGLGEGSSVWLVVKTHSCLVLKPLR